VYTSGPRVRLVTASSPLDRQLLTANDSLTLHFDRPIKKRDYRKFLSFDPPVKFSAVTGSQEVTVSFSDNLESATDYTLRLKPAVESTDSRKMKTDFYHQFTTASPVLAYLKRDAGKQQQGQKPGDDIIYQTDLDGNKTILFTAPVIRNFAANGSHLYAVTDEGAYDQLVHIDRRTKQRSLVPLLLDGYPVFKDGLRVKSLQLAPRSDVLVLTFGIDYSSSRDRGKTYYDDTLHTYDPATKTMRAVKATDKRLQKAYDLHVSRDGQLVLFGDQDQFYSIVNIYSENLRSEVIGSFDLSGGFNRNAAKVLLFDEGAGTVLNGQDNQRQAVPFDQPTYNALFQSDSDDLWVYRQQYAVTHGVSEVLSYRMKDSTERQVWYGRGTIQYLAPSFDDQYLALELQPDNCRYDEIDFNGQCSATQTVIIDTSSGDEVLKFSGYNNQWLASTD